MYTRKLKRTARVLIFTMALEIFAPFSSFALTSGPSQPEVEGFKPVGITDMVNPFTGDFSYNLPLLEVDGYPINISYSSGITSDQEASWVGLGWNINPGVINRSMRGIPDDFNGDQITKEFNYKNNKTVGVTVGASFEAIESDHLSLGYSLGISCNNYTGFDVQQTLSPSVSAGIGSKGSMNMSLGLTSSSSGLSVSPNVSFSNRALGTDNPKGNIGLSIGTNFDSRQGLTSMTLGVNAQRNRKALSGGFGTGISFLPNSYTPNINMPMKNYSGSFSFKPGGTFLEANPSAHISGYISEQSLNLTNGRMTIPAYGYTNTHNAVKGRKSVNSLLDVNRDWDGAYTQNTPSLPVTSFTYDMFNVSGQGISGSFRPFRNDIGYVSDNYAQNNSVSASFGGELAAGNAFKGGIDINANFVETTTQTWSESNPVISTHYHKGIKGNDPLYEPYSYIQQGELSVNDDNTFVTQIGNKNAVKVGLTGGGFNVSASRNLIDNDGRVTALTNDNTRSSRMKRNQTFNIITYSEKNAAGSKTNRNEMIHQGPKDHIAEVQVTRNDGARYVYGVPAYNLSQEETSFSVGLRDNDAANFYDRNLHETKIDRKNGVILYGNKDNTKNNTKGDDNFYSSTKMPAYAHSYLLTTVLSTDYVDADNTPGPSKGDIGNYTLFNYDKIEKYNWRTPYENMEANLTEGLLSTAKDDQGNYVYGEKEVWFLKSIESKNTIAIFHTEDRKDGFGVMGRNGGRGDVTTKLLRKISIYSKADYDNNPSLAIPIKEVHFEYDYSLCPNVLNNNGEAELVIDPLTNNTINLNENKGKLTLKKIYFTYGTSNKAKFSPYAFDYTNLYDASFNPEYGMKNYDRWGSYKENGAAGVYNGEYPYTLQDKTLADKYASAWTLSKINLPTGGQIKIVSEADDYAYVQNKRAMEMFEITSIVKNYNVPDIELLNPNNNRLMSTTLLPSNDVNKYLTIKLREPLENNSEVRNTFYKKYVEGINDLYFKFKVDITKSSDFENISGFAELDIDGHSVDKYGLFGLNANNKFEYAYLKIKAVPKNDNSSSEEVHPISKAAWHFGRMNLPQKIYDEIPNTGTCDIDGLIAQTQNSGFVKNIIQTIQGQNGYMNNKGFGKRVVLNRSYIRLNSPNNAKLGGGLRVKRIELNDQWNTMTSVGFNETYGQNYSYTTIDEISGLTISSGVASYEPMVGGDENPFKLPIYFGDDKKRLLVPDDKAFLLGPIGESFFPSPSIGYSKVTVTSISEASINRHGTGKTVQEFYTAKDFPTLTSATGIDAKPKKSNPLLKIFSFDYKDYMNVSQGYSIIVNDMHGKPKANWVYQKGASKPISGSKSIYQSSKIDETSFKLDNFCDVIRPDGSVESKEIGVEYDFVMDFREQETETVGAGLSTNLGTFLAAFIPGIVPLPIPKMSKERTRFRSAVATKVISTYGILKETIAYDLDAKISSENLAYDSESGLVLLTRTTNNFDEHIYSFNYPAHWYYDGMGQAYKNLGLQMQLSVNSSGISTVTNANKYFYEGDEVLFDGNQLAWVKIVNESSVEFMNISGKNFSTNSQVKNAKVIRSGRRNLIGLGMGTIVSKDNPIKSIRSNSFNSLLNANVQVYKDEWETYCECFNDPYNTMKVTDNKYVTGQKGVWRAYKSFAYLTPREHTWENNNTNIRNDGYYTSFNPFWKNMGNHWDIDQSNWTWTSEITKMTPYGTELEEKDALERHSAATYGYNNTIATSVGKNSMYKELGFDGFEDYNFEKCSDDHFSFRHAAPNLLPEYGHTGKYFMRINNSNPVALTKPLIENCPPENN